MNMYAINIPLTRTTTKLLYISYLPSQSPQGLLYVQSKQNHPHPFTITATEVISSFLYSLHFSHNFRNKKRSSNTLLRTSRRESPYQLLGVSPSVIPEEIKRAYQKFALNIPDPTIEVRNSCERGFVKGNPLGSEMRNDIQNEVSKESSIEDNINEIEATLAQLKKGIGALGKV